MERAMFGNSLRDQIRTELIRGTTKVTESDITKRISYLKWPWVSYIVRRTDSRLGRKVLGCRPQIDVRSFYVYQQWRMTWLRPRICGGCRPLPTAQHDSGRPTTDMGWQQELHGGGLCPAVEVLRQCWWILNGEGKILKFNSTRWD